MFGSYLFGKMEKIIYQKNIKKIIHFNVPQNNKLEEGYDVYVTDTFDYLSDACSKFDLSNKKICIVTDDIVSNLYLNDIENIFKRLSSNVFSIKLNHGENVKNNNTINDLYAMLVDHDMNRDDFLVALGGGVIGDITGYLASSFKRGLNYIQVPTTLLAQVDASIGGKCAIDFNNYKNIVGAFYQPVLVYSNVMTYKDLPREERINGMGEVIKAALIYDKDFFNYLEKSSCEYTNNFLEFLVNIVYNSILVKKYFVEIDPFDTNERHMLNFGHTVGHAIERATNYEIKHGQAITLGMAVAMKISRNKSLISVEDEIRFAKTCVSYGLSITMNFTNAFIDSIIANLSQDKKNTCDGLNYVLLEKIGKANISKNITQDDILTAMNYQ